MSEEIKEFFKTYTDFVTKVTSDPSLDLEALNESFKEIENKILKIMPKLKLYIIKDAWHLPHMEQTNNFNNIFFNKILNKQEN